MTEDEKKQFEKKLNFLYNETKEEDGIENSDELIANPEMFGVNKIDDEINYKEEMMISFYESKEVIETMASMYLDENEDILKHKYIRNKIINDAQNLSDMSFLQNISKRAIIKQMEQIEMGDGTPRHYETLSIMMREIRENIKQSTMTVSTMERFYKDIRSDSGMNDQINISESPVDETRKSIITTTDVNSQIERILKNKNLGEGN